MASRPPIVAPETIARSLDTVLDIIKESADNIEQASIAYRIVKAAQNNVRMLFDLKLGPDNKMQFENAGQVWMLVDIIMRSGTAPQSYDNDPAKIFIGVSKALEVGVEPIGGLANIMIVNNRPCVWGDLAQALIQRSGQVAKQHSEKIGTWPEAETELPNWDNSAGWRVSTWRKGQDEPYVGEYTVGDARRAKLWMHPNKKPWITDPDAMLFNRARARSQRAGFADGLYGMAIAEEQLDYQVDGGKLHHQPHALPKPQDDDEPVTQLEAPKPEVPTDFGESRPLESVPTEEPPTDQGDKLI